jgi:hypothetical protein
MSNIKTIEEIATAKGRRRAKTMLEDFERRYPNYIKGEDEGPAFCVTFLSNECNALCHDITDGTASCLECWKQPVPEGIR